MDIETIIKVDITKEAVSQNVRDLNTPAYIQSEDYVFPELYRKYSDTDTMLEDGFTTSSPAFIAAQRAFSQSPRPQEIIVANAKTETVADVTTVNWVETIAELYAATNEFVVFAADVKDDADKEAIAEYIETKDLVFVTSDSNPNTITSDTTDLASKLKAKNLQKTVVMYYADGEIVAPEMAYIGRHISAEIGSNLWGYKTLVGLTADKLSNTAVQNLMNKNVQFYTNVGKDSAIVGNMATVGGEKIHVILGIIWLKIRIAERYWNLLYTNERILYTNEGIDRFKAELYTVLSQAVINQILTDETPFQIYTPDARSMTSQQRESGVLSGITFRARLAGAIIFVNGVRGTVYA